MYIHNTDKHSYLAFNSFHPPHIKNSIVYSQALRYKRLCSDPSDFENKLHDLESHFLKRGYPPKLIHNNFYKAKRKNRQDLLHSQTKTRLERIPLVTTHHPIIPPFFKQIKSLWHLLSTSHPTIEKFCNPPVLALKQPPNLQSLLVHSKHPRTPHSQPDGNKHCGNSRCMVCKFMLTSKTVSVPGSNVKLYPGNFNCNSSNVTYFLTCTRCSMGNYIGETKTPFRLRFNNHKSSIRRHLSGLPVSEHFNSPNHSLSDLRFAILRGNYPD